MTSCRRDRPGPAHVAVSAARAARLAFGLVMLAGAALLVERLVDSRGVPHAALVIVGTWTAALAAAGLARALVARRGWAAGERWFAASVALPAVGVALLLPLTLQLPLVVLVGSVRLFDEWARIALLVVGGAHLALAVLVAIRAAQLAGGRRALSPLAIYWITVLVSCVPAGFLLGIPPAIVAVTGVPFVRLLQHMQHLVEHERRVLARAPGDLPRAVVVAA